MRRRVVAGRRIRALATLVLAALALGPAGAAGLSASFSAPEAGQTFTDPEIGVAGTASVESAGWELRGAAGFREGTLDGVVPDGEAGLRLQPLFRDDFNGSALQGDLWMVSRGGDMKESVGSGELSIFGVEDDEVWGGTVIRTRAAWSGSFMLTCSIAAGGSGTGYGLNIGVIVSDNLFFRAGPLCDNSRSRNSLLYVNYKTGGGGGEGIQSDDDPRDLDSRYHPYAMVYNASSGRMGLYIDGALKTSKQWVANATNYSIFIGAWGRYNGDRLDARVDHVGLNRSRGTYFSVRRPMESSGLFLRSMNRSADTPAGTGVSAAVRSGNGTGAGPEWLDAAAGAARNLLLGEWLQFRLDLYSDDPLSSPTARAASLCWSPEVLSASASLDGLSWAPLDGTTGWNGTVVLRDGQNDIRVRVTDTAGNSVTINRTAVLERIPGVPSGRLVINSGDDYAASRSVTLGLLVHPGPAAVSMKVGNGPDLASLPWVPFCDTVRWELSGPDGTCIVYAMLLSAEGMQSRMISDSIILDTTPPGIGILQPGDGSRHYRSRIDVRGNASDQNGLRLVELRLDGGAWYRCDGLSAWNATASLPARAAHRIEARATDIVGHSSQTSITVRRDPAPSTSVLFSEWTAAAVLILVAAALACYAVWRSQEKDPE